MQVWALGILGDLQSCRALILNMITIFPVYCDPYPHRRARSTQEHTTIRRLSPKSFVVCDLLTFLDHTWSSGLRSLSSPIAFCNAGTSLYLEAHRKMASRDALVRMQLFQFVPISQLDCLVGVGLR